jgi:hypothetical protein
MGTEGQAAIEAGGLVVDVFIDGAQTTQMDAWIQTESLHVSVCTAKDGQTLAELQSREWSYIVDLSTMKIVWTGFGSYSGQAPDSFLTAINQLHTYLGN